MGKKKRKKSRRGGRWSASPQQVGIWLAQVEQQLQEEKYKGAAQTARRVMRHVPQGSKPYGEAQYYLGAALLMLQEYEDAYQVLSDTLETSPEDPTVWYNRGIVCRFVGRIGQSVRDLEQALELETTPNLQNRYKDALAFSRKLCREELAIRGPDFTLEQLIKQQEIYQDAVQLMASSKWTEAEAIYRQVIKLGDGLPQPWGNLGTCLIMQERYDEAESALNRALEIDPDYEIARQNLLKLPFTRQSGPAGFEINRPFEGERIKQSLTIIEE
ncbi:MAG: tetratricopeptide repeat protein [Chloroflexi bacterium]|nr:tetratricopeptide repeat protein [Chloroflexota bacterium]